MNHQLLIGHIPLQMSSSYQRVNGNILAFQNKLKIQRNNQQYYFSLISPLKMQGSKQIQLFNWKIDLEQSVLQIYTENEFQTIYQANTYLLSDLYKTNSEKNIQKSYRNFESYFDNSYRLNILLDLGNFNKKLIDFKLNPNSEPSDYTTNNKLYIHKNRPFVIFIVYDKINLEDQSSVFYQKLVNQKAFPTIDEAYRYYGCFDGSVRQLLYNSDTNQGNIVAFRSQYPNIQDNEIAFTAYALHIQQFHQNADPRYLSSHQCENCQCSAINISPLMQPQLVPISILQEYPLELNYYDMIANIYQGLLCQFKIWSYQDSIESILGMPISDECMITSQCNGLHNYENLELLGDSVLKYVVSVDLFLNYESLNEGDMTNMRSNVIRNSFLAQLFNLNAFIINQDLHFKQMRNPLLNILITNEDQPLQESQMADLYEAIGGDIFYKQQSLYDFIKYLRRTNFPITDMQHKLLDFNGKQNNQTTVYLQIEEYKFKNPQLYEIALTQYERLEFLGDAAIELLVINKLYKIIQNKNPGLLTELKSKLLSNNFMGKQAIQMGLVKQLEPQLIDIPKRYGDVFESVAAALLLDGGWNALESVYGKIYENELNNNKYVLI